MGGNFGASGCNFLPFFDLTDLVAPGALVVLFCFHIVFLFFSGKSGQKKKKKQNKGTEAGKTKPQPDPLLGLVADARELLALAKELKAVVAPGAVPWAAWMPQAERDLVEKDLYPLLTRCLHESDVPAFLADLQALRHRALVHCANKYDAEHHRAMHGDAVLPLEGEPAKADDLWEAMCGADDRDDKMTV